MNTQGIKVTSGFSFFGMNFGMQKVIPKKKFQNFAPLTPNENTKAKPTYLTHSWRRLSCTTHHHSRTTHSTPPFQYSAKGISEIMINLWV